MTRPTDFFAQAERLASWARVALGLEGHALQDLVQDWRSKNAVPLSDLAIAVLVNHVCARPLDDERVAA